MLGIMIKLAIAPSVLLTISTGIQSTWSVTNKKTGNIIHVSNGLPAFSNASSLKRALK